MWTKIQCNLINLNHLKEIYRDDNGYCGIGFIGVNGDHNCFIFETREERDQEFDRLERLLLNERGW